MAKSSYKIPEHLNKTQLDIKVSLQSADGHGPKPIPLYILLTWFMVILGAGYAIMGSFVKSGGIIGILVFLIAYFIFCSNLIARDDSGLMQASLVSEISDYVPKNKKRVNARSITKNVYNLYSFLNIDDIDENSGLIKFNDGSLAYAYRIVGNASAFLFDEDRSAIIDRYDSYLSTLDLETEPIIITAKEPQQVGRQIYEMKERYDNLKYNNDELKELLNAQFNCLKDEIGGSYRSIHQYLILKSKTSDDLIRAVNRLRREVESSTLVFRGCQALNYDEVCEMFSHIYSNEGGI